jgi:hypothetical protein
MSFTETYLDPQRWTEFSFFATGGVDGAISESVAPGKPFKIHEFRIHNSIAIASAGDLVIRLSAAQGSAHNMVFISKAMLGSTDYWLLFSNPLIFQSDDQIVVTYSMKSAVNVMGINVVGWAVRG